MDITSSTVGQSGALLHDLLAAHVARHPEREALRFRGNQLSWAVLQDRVSRNAAALRTAGVRPGDRVALLDFNHPAWVELAVACARIGAVLVPMNSQLAITELEYIINDSAATVLFLGHLLAPLVTDDPDSVPTVRRRVVIGGPDDEYEAWLNIEPDGGAHRADPRDTVLQLYTSGTTGFPKGALLTHAGLIGNARATSAALQLDSDDATLIATPLSQAAAVSAVMIQLHLGGRSVIMRVPDPLAICQTLHEEHISHTFLAPALLDKITRQPRVAEFDYSALRVVRYGASPMPLPTLRACLAAFPQVFVQVYGMTEVSGAVSLLGRAEHTDGANPHRLRSVGKPFDHVRIAIRDQRDRTTLPPGSTGEIWIHTPDRMTGYWNLPQATEQAFDEAGWYRTGDAGYLDDDGYLYITDRLDDVIISGGETVYPAEIEQVLAEHPSVAGAAVIGVPDDTWGEVPKAVVVAVSGSTLVEGELLAYCDRNLAAHQCPRSVSVVTRIPRNSAGKLLRREIRDTFLGVGSDHRSQLEIHRQRGSNVGDDDRRVRR